MISTVNLEFSHRRLLSCMIDHFLFTGIAAIVIFPGIVVDLFTSPFELAFYSGNSILNTIGLSIYLSKDVWFSQTLGRLVLDLDLVDSRTGEKAGPLQLVVRNITFILWPIEILLLLGPPHKRLGDYIAKTLVIARKKDKVVTHKPASVLSTLLSLILAIIVSYLFVIVFSGLVEKVNATVF